VYEHTYMNTYIHTRIQVTGDVSLELEGACGTCPSSTVTLKMGIERALREQFGDRLGEVRQVKM